MPLLQDFATDDAAHRIYIFWTGAFIANDRSLFNEAMEAACGIDEFVRYDAGKVVFYEPNNLNSQLDDNRIIGAPPGQVGMLAKHLITAKDSSSTK